MTPKETLAQGITEGLLRKALEKISVHFCEPCTKIISSHVLALIPSKAEEQAKAFLEDVKIVNDMLWYPADGTNTEEDRFQAQMRIREKHLPALGYPSQWKGPTEYERQAKESTKPWPQPVAYNMTADEFNKKYPVGTPVYYHYIIGGPVTLKTKTRTPAWTINDGVTVLVSIEGKTGGMILESLSLLDGTEISVADGSQEKT